MTVPAGLVAPGNIDLGHRPVVKNKDGTISTVRSMSFEEGGREILVPTVSDDGRILSDDEAVDLYHRTGKHLGQFRSATEATAYAQQLHEQQAQQYGSGSMTPPIRPEPEFNPESVTDWINVLHNAKQVASDSPDYADAQAVAGQAWARIGHLNRKASTADREAQNFKPSNPVLSGLAGLAQGASLGIGEPIAGAIDAATGGTFREGAQKYREGLEQAAVSNPATFAASEFAGQVAPSLLPIKSAVGAVQARVPLTAADKLIRIARGGASGATVGGVAGFAAGGEDPGDFSQRFDQAKTGAEIGGAMGGTLTGIGLRAGRATAEKNADLMRRGVEDAQAQVNLDASRLRLQRLQERADVGDAAPTTDLPIRQVSGPAAKAAHPDIVRAVQDFEAGKISGPDLRTAMDVARGRAPTSGTGPVPSSGPQVDASIRPGPDGPPQGPPSPPQSTRPDFWDPSHPNVLPPNLAARQTGQPDLPYDVLYPNAEAEAPPMGRPNMLAEDVPVRKARKTKAPKIGQKMLGATVVEPGPYQKAAPASRMQSAAQGEDRFAQRLADDPESALAQLELARSLGVEPHPGMVERLNAELTRRRMRALTPEDQ